LSWIMGTILMIREERDDATQRNDPLLKQVSRKELMIEEKTKEITRLLQTRSAREESLKESATKLVSRIIFTSSTARY